MTNTQLLSCVLFLVLFGNHNLKNWHLSLFFNFFLKKNLKSEKKKKKKSLDFFFVEKLMRTIRLMCASALNKTQTKY